MANKVSSGISSAEIKAGVFLTFCLALFIAMLFVHGKIGRAWRGKQNVCVAFTNISALRKEAQVHYNGMDIGSVKDIEIVRLDDRWLDKLPPLTKDALPHLPFTSQEREDLAALPDESMKAQARQLLRGRTMVILTLDLLFENDARRYRADDEYRISASYMGDSAVEIHTGAGQELPPGSGHLFLGVGGDIYTDLGKSISQVKDILASMSEMIGGHAGRETVQSQLANFENFTTRAESMSASLDAKLPETWDNLDRRVGQAQNTLEDLKTKIEKMKPEWEETLQKAERSIGDIRRNTAEAVLEAQKKITAYRQDAKQTMAEWQKTTAAYKETIPAQIKSGRDWTDRFAPTVAKIDNLFSRADDQLNSGLESTRTTLRDFISFAGDFEERTYRLWRWPWSFAHPPEKELAEAYELAWRRELARRQYAELRAELERMRSDLKNAKSSDTARMARVEQILKEADNAFEPPSAAPEGGEKQKSKKAR